LFLAEDAERRRRGRREFFLNFRGGRFVVGKVGFSQRTQREDAEDAESSS